MRHARTRAALVAVVILCAFTSNALGSAILLTPLNHLSMHRAKVALLTFGRSDGAARTTLSRCRRVSFRAISCIVHEHHLPLYVTSPASVGDFISPMTVHVVGHRGRLKLTSPAFLLG
jgi:hypothetical protein